MRNETGNSMGELIVTVLSFGKIFPMIANLRWKRRGLGLFLSLLLVACSPQLPPDPPSLVNLAEVSAEITLTPFQPNEGTPLAASDPGLVLPTYTPYPSQYVPSQGIQGAIQVQPAADGTGLPLYNPLTGLPIIDPAPFEQRPFAIKIANSPDYVRPQSGLTLADVVFEYYIEWGDTRFIAVFYSNHPVMVGPVRSGRYFDEHVTRMYHAFLVFKSADPRELNYLKSGDLNDFLVIVGFGGCSPYFTGPYRRDSYNNQFFNTTKWEACADKKGVDNSRQFLSGGFFSEEEPGSALIANRIFSFYSVYNYNYWEYDPATHKYFRYQESTDMDKGQSEAYAALTDAQTGLPVTAENIVTLFVPHTYANPYNADDQVFNIDLLDFGNAYVFRDGEAIPALWTRPQADQPILLTTLEGDPIFLRPGRTFYQVLGVNSTYTQQGTDWRFVFQTP